MAVELAGLMVVLVVMAAMAVKTAVAAPREVLVEHRPLAIREAPEVMAALRGAMSVLLVFREEAQETGA